MCCVGQVAEAGDVLAAARRTAADAVILDLMLQGGSGLPLIADLAAALPSLRIIVFSGIAFNEDVAREAKRRGAAAFVTKGSDFEVLLDAVRRGSRAA
jgi:DNA-binding NarL/FixJ family response regulator